MGNLTTYSIYQAQYPASTLTQAQFDALVPVVSRAIETYLNRNLQSQTYNEWHDGHKDTILMTKEWPVTKIYGISASFQPYSSITITSLDNVLTMHNNAASQIIEFVKDFGTEFSYDYSGAANVSTMVSTLSTVMAGNSISNTVNSNNRYDNCNVDLVVDIRYRSTGANGIIDIVGPDLTSQINYALQGERFIVLSKMLPSYSNVLYIKYTGGYILPSGLSNGTLPWDIIDAANRIIKEISDYDNSGVSGFLKSESLGDASYTYADDLTNKTFVSGLVKLYESQLEKYRRLDIIVV